MQSIHIVQILQIIQIMHSQHSTVAHAWHVRGTCAARVAHAANVPEAQNSMQVQHSLQHQSKICVLILFECICANCLGGAPKDVF